MKPKISLVTLGVADLQRSTEFYRDGLHLPTYGDFPGVTFFQLAGTWLAVFPREELARDAPVSSEGQGFPGFSLAHNVGSKAEVDAVVQEAVRGGAKVTRPPAGTEWGGYAGYFTDPDGYLWEVAWNPHFDLT